MLTSALMFRHQNWICNFCTTLETLTNIQSIAVVIFNVLLHYDLQKVQLFALTKWLGSSISGRRSVD